MEGLDGKAKKAFVLQKINEQTFIDNDYKKLLSVIIDIIIDVDKGAIRIKPRYRRFCISECFNNLSCCRNLI
jgi:hypothetical protein